MKKIELQTEIIGFSFVFLKFFIKEVPRKKLDCTIRIIKSHCSFGNLINKKGNPNKNNGKKILANTVGNLLKVILENFHVGI